MIITAQNLPALCDELTSQDSDLQKIIDDYDYPPYWSRPNTFESLVHIILEQQVSLASAQASLDKLIAHTGQLTPENLLAIPDDVFKSLYVSRQKRVYLQGLAQAIVTGQLQLAELETLSDTKVRVQLTQLKGIGNWTADIYLLFVLHRADIFPLGDLAAVNALRGLKRLDKTVDLLTIVEPWRPLRTVATLLLWHYYLSAGRGSIAR
jgi:DNA-3-methyladenine glycosylase II